MSEQTTESKDQTKEPTEEPTDEMSAADLPCADQSLGARVEALLMSTDRPLSEGRLAQMLGLEGKGISQKVRDAIDELNAEYDKTGRAFRIEGVAGGQQILTKPEFGPLLARLHTDRQQSKLSQAALETLSIIAYRQPLMRAEIEAIRGVACGEVLRGLLERRMVKIVGRAEVLGRPMLYGTTKEFLNVFGLASVDDLPAVQGLERSPSYVKPEETDGKDAANTSNENEVTEADATIVETKSDTEATVASS